MGRTSKYYPSSPFSPSVALGALLTRNWVVGLGEVYLVKRLCLFVAIFGDFVECGYYRDFGEKPHYPLCPHSPLYQPRAKRTILLRQNFVMPRLCYGSAEQVNLLCSHLNRKVHLSPFTFHFSVYMRRRHHTFQFSPFSFHFTKKAVQIALNGLFLLRYNRKL